MLCSSFCNFCLLRLLAVNHLDQKRLRRSIRFIANMSVRSGYSTVRKSVALDTATLKVASVSAEQIAKFRETATAGNPFARCRLDTGTGFLQPPPQAHKWDLTSIFSQFDSDGDGVLDMGEFQRAFRALGLKKRSGAKMDIDAKMFQAFDVSRGRRRAACECAEALFSRAQSPLLFIPLNTVYAAHSRLQTNGDGVVSLAELEENLFPATRAKIEEKLDAGWKFDKKKWEASVARHSRINMAKVFKQFDFDGDGCLTMNEFKRAFRALGLKKRDGKKMEIDEKMFRSFGASALRAELKAQRCPLPFRCAHASLLSLLQHLHASFMLPTRMHTRRNPHSSRHQRRRNGLAPRVREQLTTEDTRQDRGAAQHGLEV